MSRIAPTALMVISLTAFATFAHAEKGVKGGKSDADGNGSISAAEYDQAALKRFKRMDANHDGVIDATELAAVAKKIEDRRAERPDAGLKAGKAGKGGEAKLEAMDTDHDGKITEAEALAASKARFAKLDKNHDGQLDAAEQASGKGGLKLGKLK